jgi:hypothetical protein
LHSHLSPCRARLAGRGKTGHLASSIGDPIRLENLRRHAAGQPLRFVVDPITYRRQT